MSLYYSGQRLQNNHGERFSPALLFTQPTFSAEKEFYLLRNIRDRKIEREINRERERNHGSRRKKGYASVS